MFNGPPVDTLTHFSRQIPQENQHYYDLASHNV
jgi:hypothetical protein